ncbi:MAG: GNAT family N-acetyltransferase [Microthrixaceae bacterium]
MQIRALNLDDVDAVLAAAELFDHAPTREWVTLFLRRQGHHLFFAEQDGREVGFISGVETIHPDKGTEMLLYELSVAEDARRQGVGTALCRELAEQAKADGCYGMWVPMSVDNDAAAATYEAAGAQPAEPATISLWEFGAQ